MRFPASRGKPACIYAHGNTRCQESCSHPNAICNHRFIKRIALRTHEQPHDAEHQGTTDSTMKRPQPHPPHEVPFIAGRSHFTHYTEQRTVSCFGFLPNTSLMQHSCSHYNAFRSTNLNECIVSYVM